MLEEMSEAMFVVTLVTRAGFYPNSECHGFDMREGFGSNYQAVGETAYLNTHIV